MNGDISLEEFDAAAQQYECLWKKAYDAGVSRTFCQDAATIKETILAQLEGERANRALIHFQDQCITRIQADKIGCRLGNALLAAGIKKGDRVGIIVSNRPENVYSFLACYKTGFIAAAYNQRCTSREIIGAMASIEAKAIIIEQSQLSKILSAVQAGECPFLEIIVVIDCDFAEMQMKSSADALSLASSPMPRIFDYESFIQTASDAEPPVLVSPNDNAILLFTGGTTGVSKGCCQTHAAMVWELQAMHYWAREALKENYPNFLVCMPMTHIMGINYGVNWQLINGGCVSIAQGHAPDDIIHAFEQYRPTAWATLPTLLHSVSKVEAFASCPYKDLDFVVFGGSFIARETLQNLISKTKARFIESYGMSESFGFVTANPVNSMGKIGSIGLPISNTDLLIVDPETGLHPVAPGERGEVIFRGPQIIQEYWRNPEETAHALRDGWLYSGDIGYMDEDGYFYIVDRKKDTIIVSGFNVFPSEIDTILLEHPSIIDACTVGVPDEHSGERPKSFLVVREGDTVECDDIRAFCRDHLVAYKIPKYIEVVAEIPKTKAKKPNRALLKSQEAEIYAKKQQQK